MTDLRASLIHSLSVERLRDTMERGPQRIAVDRWWLGAALFALHTGRFHLITNRAGTALYMLRCWLSVPKQNYDRMVAGAINGEAYESGNSQLLHWILEPDDCSALHDHPWSFETEILEGGYGEYTNTMHGCSQAQENECHTRSPGDTVNKGADNLHAIGTLLAGSGRILPTGITGGAWTSVRTGPRHRPWGFHPPGGEWTPRDTYLRGKAKL